MLTLPQIVGTYRHIAGFNSREDVLERGLPALLYHYISIYGVREIPEEIKDRVRMVVDYGSLASKCQVLLHDRIDGDLVWITVEKEDVDLI